MCYYDEFCTKNDELNTNGQAEGSQDVGGGGDAFSKDAIRTLLTEVENYRTSCLVVLAGYKVAICVFKLMSFGFKLMSFVFK